MFDKFNAWFKKLRTHIGVYLAREEVDALREYSFEAEQRAYKAERKGSISSMEAWNQEVNEALYGRRERK